MKDGLIIMDNALLTEGLTIRQCICHVTPFEENTFVSKNLCIRSYDYIEHENAIAFALTAPPHPQDKARARPIRHDLAGNFKIARVKKGGHHSHVTRSYHANKTLGFHQVLVAIVHFQVTTADGSQLEGQYDCRLPVKADISNQGLCWYRARRTLNPW